MNNDNITPEIISTGDGSHSLYLPHLDETYHSRHGAKKESEHVFIVNGLDQLSGKKEISVLEVGFGTGLNALLTADYAAHHSRSIVYHTLETHPLPLELMMQYAAISQFNEREKEIFSQLHQAAWNEEVGISKNFSIQKWNQSLQEVNLGERSFDVIFYDAFGPRAQPEMWSKDLFEKLFHCTNVGGVLVTYCAKGQVRRDMESVGFDMERLPGPPGKREMLRATKRH